jgi:hypothetical protein
MPSVARWMLAILLLLATGAVGVAKDPGPSVVVRYDPDKPNRQTAVIWLAYLVARTAFHEKHHLLIPASGEIRPSFAEELDARKTAAQIYRELKAKDAKMRDAYWDVLSQVDEKGFMGAYVWTFLRRPEWPASNRPRNLPAFEQWKQRGLPNHQPQTYGWLERGKP